MVNYDYYHIVLVPTRNRPRLLGRLLKSIAENTKLYGYPSNNVSVIVIDSSSDFFHRRQNQSVVKNLVENIPDFNIIYYDEKRQDEFINSLQGYFPDLQKYIWDERIKGRGFGGVRNFSLLIGLYHSTHNTIFSFIDDDCSLKNLVYGHGGSKIAYSFSYFEKLDVLFEQHKEVNVVSGDYTRDYYEAPWLIVHLLDILDIFFKEAMNKEAKDVTSEEFWHKIFELEKPWGFAIKPARTNFKFEDTLRILAASCNLMKDYGAYRLIPTAYYPHDFLQESQFLHGGNCSFRKSSIIEGVPYPVGGWRGEDCLWSFLMEKIIGSTYIVNIPVGHFRTLGGKRNIDDEFSKDLTFDMNLSIVWNLLPNEKYSRSDVANALKFGSINKSNLSGFPYAWYVKPGERWGIDKWNTLSKNIKRDMSANNWIFQGKYRKRIEKIANFLNYFGDPKIVDRIKSSIPDVDVVIKSTRLYGELIENWPSLMEALEKKREADERAGILTTYEGAKAEMDKEVEKVLDVLDEYENEMDKEVEKVLDDIFDKYENEMDKEVEKVLESMGI